MGSQHSSRVNSELSANGSNSSAGKKTENLLSDKNMINSFSQISNAGSKMDCCSSMNTSRALSSRSCSSNSCSSYNASKQNISNINEICLPTIFDWEEGGKEVSLIGDFTNWEEKIELQYNENENKHSTMLFLTKGTYQFKFIVDGEAKISSKYQTIPDKDGNLNNIIFNSDEITKIDNFQPTRSTQRKKTEKKVKFDLKEQTEKKQEQEQPKHKTKSHGKGKSSSKIPYSQNFPEQSDLSVIAPPLPTACSSNISFSLDPNNSQSKDNFLLPSFSQCENGCYKESSTPFHGNINHLLIKCEQYDTFYSLSSSLRVGKKFTTIVYCHPLGDKPKKMIDVFNDFDII